MKKNNALPLILIIFVGISVTSISAQSNYEIPSWFKGVANFWAEGNIDDDEFGESISFLVNNEIIKVPKIQELENEIVKLKAENSELRSKLNSVEPTHEPDRGEQDPACVGCSMEEAREVANQANSNRVSIWTDRTDYGHDERIVITGKVEKVSGFPITITVINPLNSRATQDQLTVARDGSFETNINTSGSMWKYDGTYTITASYGSDENSASVKIELSSRSTSTLNCDPSYPDVCIAPYPPDLNCGDIRYTNFRVIGSDPHGFDRDNDGIGCES
ncbi:hypothetical protein [Nitrosopumilus sp.]|uniref:hypothetical protein n=1 Tax=Nitrosopumilus sp. TaxID=2024843 RepID=UPI003D0F6D70